MKPPYVRRWWHDRDLIEIIVVGVVLTAALLCFVAYQFLLPQSSANPPVSERPADPDPPSENRARPPPVVTVGRSLFVFFFDLNHEDTKGTKMDFESPAESKELTPAETAVRYILHRVVNSRDFSWHMMHTTSLRKCIQAESWRTGASEEDVERQLHDAMNEMQPRLDRNGEGKAQLVVAREKLDAIRDVMLEFDSRGDMDPAVMERIEAIIDGRKPRDLVRQAAAVTRGSSLDMPSWLSTP